MNAMPVRAYVGEVTRVVVIDDHRAFADLLALVLRGEPEFSCVGTAESLAQGLPLVERLQPDIVVMDLQLGDGDGISATARLVERNPAIRVVILTAYADTATLGRASEAGACALLPKDGSLPELLDVLRGARRGGLVVEPRLLRRLLSSTQPVRMQQPPLLTRREHEVLQLLAEGLNARAASMSLDITLNTCRGHIKNLLLKLGAHSQLEAVAVATRNGLIDARATS